MEKLNQHHDKKGQEDLPAPSGAHSLMVTFGTAKQNYNHTI